MLSVSPLHPFISFLYMSDIDIREWAKQVMAADQYRLGMQLDFMTNKPRDGSRDTTVPSVEKGGWRGYRAEERGGTCSYIYGKCKVRTKCMCI